MMRYVIGVCCLIISLQLMAMTNQEMTQRYEAFLSAQVVDSLLFTMESTEHKGVISGTAATFLPGISFNAFAEHLSEVSQWCEFIPLHLNIKACMYQNKNQASKIGFYVGVKGYMPPDEAELLLLDFDAGIADDVFMAKLTAEDGPYGSSNYDFEIRAIDINNGVYLEFDLSSKPGFIAGLAKLYLATIGRKKIGFSVSGHTASGQPKYVRGQRAGAERNIVRYLLSIEAYFQTIDRNTLKDNYQKRLEKWFDLTQNYNKQLYEMSREEYLAIKQRERANQFILLDAIKNNVTPAFGIDTYNP